MPTSVSPKARKGFDYNSLDAEISQFVQQQTGEIRVLMKRTAQGIIEVGHKLIEVKKRLGHGYYLAWLEAEFGWSHPTAARFMQVANSFSKNRQIDNFAPSALYELAAPSTPKAAREEALARAESGESITYTDAKAIKQKYATPPTTSKPEAQIQPEPEPISQLQATPASAPPSQLGSKLEIIAIHRQGQATALEEASRVILPTKVPLSVPQLSQNISVPDVPGVWWQLGGRHLLYCGEPNSPEYLAQITAEKVSLLLAFPPTPGWLPVIQAWTRLIIFEYLPEGKDSRLFQDAIEANLLLCSDVGDMVASCFIPSPEILSIVNRLDRRGLFAEPDSSRVNAVILDWKKAGLKVERVT